MKIAYLSLGSNMGQREAMLQKAIKQLHSKDLHLTRLSSVYETAPVDVKNQPMFLNLVVEAETTLFPMRLLARCQSIEKEMGRKRVVAKGPRNIDIDILLFGKFHVETPQLEIPHPRMSERRFVLEPLAELAPDLRHPSSKQTMRELLAGTASQKVHKTQIKLTIPDSAG